MRVMVLLAAAGAACGDGLMEAVREGLGIEARGISNVIFKPFSYVCEGKCPSVIKGQPVPANWLANVTSGVTDLCVDPRSVVAADGTVTINNHPIYPEGKQYACNRSFDSMRIEYSGGSPSSPRPPTPPGVPTGGDKKNNPDTDSTSPPSNRAAVLAPAIMGVVGVVVSMLL